MIQKLSNTDILNTSSISDINKLISNYSIHKFSHLTQPQILKLFKITPSKIFSETNSKKHLNKIYELIKSQFINSKTNHYLSILLQPTSDKNIYNLRKKAFKIFQSINIQNTSQLNSILKNLENFNEKISFPNRLITFENEISDYFYKKFKLTIETITKEELEQLSQQEDLSNAIIISDEDLFCELDIFSKKEFEKLIYANIIKNNSTQIQNLIEFSKEISQSENLINESLKTLLNIDFTLNLDLNLLKEILEENPKEKLENLTQKTLKLEEEIEKINYELKEIISKKQLSLAGDELLNLLNSGDLEELKKKIQKDIFEKISQKEKEIISYYKQHKIHLNFIFQEKTYPLKIDEEIKDEILKKIENLQNELNFEIFKKLSQFKYEEIEKLLNKAFLFDFLYGISKFIHKYNLNYPNISEEITLINCRNIYLEKPTPINYGIGTSKLNLNNEKVSILTGANSGGKTTLLEMVLQASILASLGVGINSKNTSDIKLFNQVIYLKKFTGTQGSGAFEQTIRNLIEIISTDNSKLLLIDEFEAITEPGAAAKILINFLKEISKQNSYCITVSHLGLEIQEFIKEENIKEIRIDGISATGLDEKGNLITNHQPQFYSLGKSTPELILKRILSDENFWKNKPEKSKKLLEKIIQ